MWSIEPYKQYEISQGNDIVKWDDRDEVVCCGVAKWLGSYVEIVVCANVIGVYDGELLILNTVIDI